MKELWNGRRKSKVEEWSCRSEVAQMAAAGSGSSEAEGDLLVSEVGVLHKDTQEDQRSFGQVKVPPQKEEQHVESAETQDYVSGPLLTTRMEPKREAEDENDMEELSMVPSAVSEPRWCLYMCFNKCREKGFMFHEIAAIVTEEGGAAQTINLCKKCHNERRAKQGEAEVAASKWRALIEQKASRGKLWASFGVEHFLRRLWGTIHFRKKRGPDPSW